MIQEYTIGRGEDCKIRLHDPSNRASRNHATLKIMKNGKIFISDYSANGTWVNGVKVMQNVDYPLKRGDTVSFAQVVNLNWEQIPKRTNNVVNFIIGFIVFILIAGGYTLVANEKNWFPFEKVEPTVPKPVEKPVASFTIEKTEAAPGDTITFTNSSKNAISYSWNFGDGSASTNENPTHSYSKKGTYTVTVTAKGDGGENSTSKTITISEKKPKPAPTPVTVVQDTIVKHTVVKDTTVKDSGIYIINQ